MIQGTTTSFELDLQCPRVDLAQAYATFSQNGKVVLELELDRMIEKSDEEGVYLITLYQAETFLFMPGIPTKLQVRYKTIFGDAAASAEMTIRVHPVQKGGVI